MNRVDLTPDRSLELLTEEVEALLEYVDGRIRRFPVAHPTEAELAVNTAYSAIMYAACRSMVDSAEFEEFVEVARVMWGLAEQQRAALASHMKAIKQ